MPLRDSVIRVKGRVNDVKRRLILPRGYRIFFLKGAGETKRVAVVREITSGASVEYSDWRQQLVLSVASPDVDIAFPDEVAQTSFWACGVPVGPELLIDMYKVDPQRRDVVAPTANNPEWKFFLTRIPEQRFNLSTAEYISQGGYWASVAW